MQGRFITLEGPEGSGKSTQARRLAARLADRGIEALATREPGGTALGEALRGLLQHNRAGEAPCQRAELLLFEASRSQLVEHVIRPALARGVWVICDRFTDSTTAYQGFGRGLPVAQIEAINRFAVNGLEPDLTLLLDLDVAAGFERVARRGLALGETADRFEREERSFHEKIRAGYLQLARENPHRFRTVNAAHAPEAVADAVWSHLADVFGLSV